ncbi:cell adhesion molecule CEACAM20 [Pempheris klunzingeri]|uniref:cell adhesion molecule CEACAM20 n=1 Tax=Pempheris klunzingeri TaxID=3127111 RepID=UPI00397F95E0
MDLFASASLLFLLSFVGCCAGQDALPEGPVDAILGANVTFKTLITNPSYVVIVWNFNDGTEPINVATLTESGLIVNEPFEGRASVDTTSGQLTLGPLKLEDAGDYSVSIVLTTGPTHTGETRLQILNPVSEVKIVSSLPEAIEHNSTVVLTCSAKGSDIKFGWMSGAVPIVADGKRITLVEGEQSSELTITGVLRSDLLGPIRCTASNQLTENSATFKLIIHYGPDEVTITPPNPAAFVRSGSNFSLSCSCISSPAATFSWYHNKLFTEVTGPVLTLKQIEELGLGKQAGEYTCSANNAKTERAVFSPGVSFTAIEPISGTEITGPTETLIAGTSKANLSCQATTGAMMSRQWLKDGKPLAPSSRLLFADNKTSIMIDVLQKEDNGVYECELSNPVTTEKASFNMMVNYGPDPAVVEGEKAVEVKDKVTLSCSAASIPPANFTWKFNGTVTAVKIAKYEIESAVYKNTGTYTCVAFNAVTGKTSTYTHTLSVKEEGALDEGLSDGAIAGIVIAVIVAVVAAIALIVYCRQKVPVESPY